MESGKRRKKRRTAILKREIFRLEARLREVHSSRISGSYSYQQTASYIEGMIQQKRKEIIELSGASLKKIE